MCVCVLAVCACVCAWYVVHSYMRPLSTRGRLLRHTASACACAAAHFKDFVCISAAVDSAVRICGAHRAKVAPQRTRHLPAPALPRRTRTLFAFAPAGRDGPVWRHCFFVIEMYVMPPTPPFSCPCCCSCCC